MEWLLIIFIMLALVGYSASLYVVFARRKQSTMSGLQQAKPEIIAYASPYDNGKLLNLQKASIHLSGQKAIIKTASQSAEFNLPATTVSTGDLVHWGKILISDGTKTWWVEPFNYTSQFLFMRTLPFKTGIILPTRDAIAQAFVKHGARQTK